jgi:hypothetical protein
VYHLAAHVVAFRWRRVLLGTVLAETDAALVVVGLAGRA